MDTVKSKKTRFFFRRSSSKKNKLLDRPSYNHVRKSKSNDYLESNQLAKSFFKGRSSAHHDIRQQQLQLAPPPPPPAMPNLHAKLPQPNLGRKVAHKIFGPSGPGGLEVNVVHQYHHSFGNHAHFLHHHDDVSAITPATGAPPESPLRTERDPHLSQPRIPRGPGMEIAVRPQEEDDVSVITPTTGVPPETPPRVLSDKKSYHFPPPVALTSERLLLGAIGDDDDDESRDLTVFEELTAVGSPGGAIEDRVSKFDQRDLIPLTQSEDGSNDLEPINIPRSPRCSLLQMETSWFVNTSYFQKVIDWSFRSVDVSRSGKLSLEQVYSGLLLINLKLTLTVGVTACKPAEREYVHEIFQLTDALHLGTINKEEYGMVVKILYSHLYTRVLFQWTLILLIVPLTSHYILKYAAIIFSWSRHVAKNLIDVEPIVRMMRKAFEIIHFFVPDTILSTGRSMVSAFAYNPLAVRNTLPLTFLIMLQALVVVPNTLMYIENFFSPIRVRESGNKKNL